MNTPAQIGSGELAFQNDAGITRAVLTGTLGLQDLPEIDAQFSRLQGEGVVFDLSGADRIDTSIAWAIINASKRLEAAGAETRISGAQGDVAQILDTVTTGMPKPDDEPPAPKGFVAWLAHIGEGVAGGGTTLVELTGILGLFLVRMAGSIIRPREFRLTALVSQCQAVGLNAVPIVVLMSFLIGVVLAFQGSAQLRQFGAEIYVVDLIAISILRELGILLTAIIVAGRTASAFTAAIGSMKMREEIDAMYTLGIDPGQALIVPRILALVLMLPILGLLADAAGLLGGAIMSWVELGISPAMFATRLIEGTDVTNVFVGIVKAPVFAILIGVIGVRGGLAVGKTAESLGRNTSSAVVAAIFAVILADAFFSIFFERIGI